MDIAASAAENMMLNVGKTLKKDQTVMCDTPHKCKARNRFGKTKCCKICPGKLNIPADSRWGLNSNLEKPSNQPHFEMTAREKDLKFLADTGRNIDALPDAGPTFGPSTSAANRPVESGSVASLALETACNFESDTFVMPCCKPCEKTMRFPPEAIVERNVDMETQSRDPSQKVVQDGLEASTPCCGGESACCRWCPEVTCDLLENMDYNVYDLWWALCSGTDTGWKPKWNSAYAFTPGTMPNAADLMDIGGTSTTPTTTGKL